MNAARALYSLRVTEAVFPERDAGSRLAHRIISRAVLDCASIGEGFSMQEIAVPEDWTAHSLLELEPSDSLLVAGRDDVLEKLNGRSESRGRKPR